MYPERPLDLSPASHSGQNIRGDVTFMSLASVFQILHNGAPWLSKDFIAPYFLTLYGVYKKSIYDFAFLK
jgi:hypothetical protein